MMEVINTHFMFVFFPYAGGNINMNIYGFLYRFGQIPVDVCSYSDSSQEHGGLNWVKSRGSCSRTTGLRMIWHSGAIWCSGYFPHWTWHQRLHIISLVG